LLRASPMCFMIDAGTGYDGGSGHCLSPYGTAYRRALATTRTRNNYPVGFRWRGFGLVARLANVLHDPTVRPPCRVKVAIMATSG